MKRMAGRVRASALELLLGFERSQTPALQSPRSRTAPLAGPERVEIQKSFLSLFL